MDDEQRRKRIEKSILLAVILGPLTLWAFRSGFYLTVFDWSRWGTATTTFFIISLLSSFLIGLALLLTWRSPMSVRRVGAIALAGTCAILGIPAVKEIAAAAIYPENIQWPWLLSVDGYAYLTLEFIVLAVTLACFALLRRTFGLCIVDEDVRELPPKSPLSIAELLYWTSGFAVVFSLVPLLNEYVERSGSTWPYWMLVLAFAIGCLSRIAPVLVLAVVPGHLLVRIALATFCVVIANVSQLYLACRYAGFPFAIDFGQQLIDALLSVAGASLALFWFWWQGERLFRLQRKAPSSMSD
ncbi:hypothetical protein [Planctomycetes bacterium K23_9]|uniref:Uncharacterized protein n=1 Tax=Stieleria marina TaxID=1930275 RepID=A0A517NQA5_9BACT|nr:hypothetical protein K239x_12500 [Planctomycetes bacterium K23_9]